MPPELEPLKGININLWEVFAFLCALLAVAAVFKKLADLFGPPLRQFRDMLDDWTGRPARPGVPAEPGVMERLASYDERIEGLGIGFEDHADKLRDIQKHVKPNGGSSAYDDTLKAINATRRTTEAQGGKIDALRELVTEALAEIGELRRDFADEHPYFKPYPRTPSGHSDTD